MTVYRITSTQYSDDISGAGSKLAGGRWNSPGIAVLYAAQHISLAVLEMLVHVQFKEFSIALDLLHIELPDNATVYELNAKKLKKGWEEDIDYSSFMGDNFIRNNQHLVMRVPSAVIDEEFNYVINPSHADFKKVKIVSKQAFRTDSRLFSIK